MEYRFVICFLELNCLLRFLETVTLWLVRIFSETFCVLQILFRSQEIIKRPPHTHWRWVVCLDLLDLFWKLSNVIMLNFLYIFRFQVRKLPLRSFIWLLECGVLFPFSIFTHQVYQSIFLFRALKLWKESIRRFTFASSFFCINKSIAIFEDGTTVFIEAIVSLLFQVKFPLSPCVKHNFKLTWR